MEKDIEDNKEEVSKHKQPNTRRKRTATEKDVSQEVIPQTPKKGKKDGGEEKEKEAEQKRHADVKDASKESSHSTNVPPPASYPTKQTGLRRGRPSNASISKAGKT